MDIWEWTWWCVEEILVMEEALNHETDTAEAGAQAQSSLSATQDRCDGHADGVAIVVGT